jgi:membrane protein YdbS with pleckstrin-like domain
MSALEQSLNPSDDNGAKGPKPEEHEERIYYEGNPRLRGELGLLVTWSILAVLALGGTFAAWYYGYAPWWVPLIGVLVAVIAILIPSLLVRRSKYRITNYRIDYEFGLLFRKYDTLELWHVDDVSLFQSPIDRMLNVGTIKIVSGDASNPTLELRSLPSPRQLLETIKQRVIAVKRQRGVVKLDMG